MHSAVRAQQLLLPALPTLMMYTMVSTAYHTKRQNTFIRLRHSISRMPDLIRLIVTAILCLCVPSMAWAAAISVTLPPLAGLVMMLDVKADVQCLLPAGADPHHFQMQPRTVERLRQSALLIRASRDDGGWPLPPLLDNTLDLWPHKDHGWVSPAAVRQALPRIAQALISMQPQQKQRILARLKQALQQVTQIAAAWRQALRQVKLTGVIMQHPAWRRLMQEMDVPVLSVLESGHHGQEFGPHRLEQALATLNQHPGAWLLADTGHSATALNWLAEHSDVPARRITLNALGVCRQPWDVLMRDDIQQVDGQR